MKSGLAQSTVEWDTECDSAIEGEGINYLSVSFLDSENGIISGESGAIIASSDGGISWEYRDAPSEVSTKAIIDVEYYSTIRAYAISEEGHILKSSREGNVPVGFVWSTVDIEREYPPGRWGGVRIWRFESGLRSIWDKGSWTIQVHAFWSGRLSLPQSGRGEYSLSADDSSLE